MKIHEILHENLLNKPTPSVAQLAAKHSVPVKRILDQIALGINVELEHTSDPRVAREIAMDHLSEVPDYYTKLNKAELEESEQVPTTVYHVTPKRNLPSIKRNGLRPTVGDRTSKIVGEISGIYVFPDVVSASDAVMNWLGDEFDEDDELSLLSINVEGLEDKIKSGAGYELVITVPIHPERIRVAQQVFECASGYIPSKKQKNDPRFKTALTKDVKPDTIKKNAKAFGFNISRTGLPPLLRK